MPGLENLQQKIKLGYELTAEEEAFVLKATTEKGVQTDRHWLGLSEPPESFLDHFDE